MAKTKKNVQKKRRQLRKKTRGGKGDLHAFLKAQAFAKKRGIGQPFNVKYYRRSGDSSWDKLCECGMIVQSPRKSADLKFDLYYLLWECNNGIARKYSIYDYEIDIPNYTIEVLLNNEFTPTTDEQKINMQI